MKTNRPAAPRAIAASRGPNGFQIHALDCKCAPEMNTAVRVQDITCMRALKRIGTAEARARIWEVNMARAARKNRRGGK